MKTLTEIAQDYSATEEVARWEFLDRQEATRLALVRQLGGCMEDATKSLAQLTEEELQGIQTERRRRLRQPRKKDSYGAAHASDVPAASELPVKKSVLVQRHKSRWPTVERDLGDAHKNGLAEAKAGARNWYESQAVAWARSRGKYRDAQTQDSTGLATSWTGKGRRHKL